MPPFCVTQSRVQHVRCDTPTAYQRERGREKEKDREREREVEQKTQVEGEHMLLDLTAYRNLLQCYSFL